MLDKFIGAVTRINTLGFFDDIIRDFFNIVMRLVYGLYFGVVKAIAWVLDLLTQLFFIFSGMTPVGSNSDAGESIDIVNFFLGQDSFVKAYGWLCLVALGLIVVFTIGKIIKQDYFDRSGPRSKAPIFRSVALSFIAFICVIPVFYFMIDAVGALALVVMKAMGYKGGGIGSMLFNLCWDDGGLLIREVADTIGNNNDFLIGNKIKDSIQESKVYDPNNFGWYSSDTFFVYYWNSTTGKARNPNIASSEFYWYIFLVTGVVLIMTLFKMIVAMITRLYKLIALFIIAPSPISQIVLDDGQKFKSWKDQVLQEALKVVGCVMGFMLFLMIATLTNDLDLMKFAYTNDSASASNLLEINNLTTELSHDVDFLYYYGEKISWIDKAINALGKALILIAGAGAVQDMDGVITPLLSGGKSSMDMGAAGKQVMDTVGGIGKDALDTSTKIFGGLASAVATGFVKGRAAKKRSLAEKMENADRNERDESSPDGDNDRATNPDNTPPGGPGGNNGGPGGNDGGPGGNDGGPEEAQTPEEANNGGNGEGGAEEAQNPEPTGEGGPEEPTPGGNDENGGPEEAQNPETETPEEANSDSEDNAEEPHQMSIDDMMPGQDWSDQNSEENSDDAAENPETETPEEPKPNEESNEGGPEEAQNPDQTGEGGPEEPKPEDGEKSEEDNDQAQNPEPATQNDGYKPKDDGSDKDETEKPKPHPVHTSNAGGGKGDGRAVGKKTKRAIKRQAKSAGRKAALKGTLDHMLRDPKGLLRTGLKSTVGFGLKTALRMVGLNKLADDGAKAINDNVFGALHDAEKNTKDDRELLRQPSLRKQAKNAKKVEKDNAKIDKAMGKDYTKLHKKEGNVNAPTDVGPTPTANAADSTHNEERRSSSRFSQAIHSAGEGIGRTVDSIKQKFADKRLMKEALNDSNNRVNENVDLANNSTTPTGTVEAAEKAIESAGNLVNEAGGANDMYKDATNGKENENLILHSAEERQQMREQLDSADEELNAATETQENAQQEMNDANSAVANNEYQRSQLVDDLHNGNEESISKFVNNTPAGKGREGVLTELAGRRGIAEISKNLNNEKYKGVSQGQLDKAYRYLSGDTSKECYEAYHGKTKGGSVSRYGGVKDLIKGTNGYNDVMNAGYKSKNGSKVNQGVVTRVANEQNKIESSYESEMLKRSGNTLDDANNRLNSAENNYRNAENNFAKNYSAMDRLQDVTDKYADLKEKYANSFASGGTGTGKYLDELRSTGADLADASRVVTKEMKTTYKSAKRNESLNRAKKTVNSCVDSVKNAGNNVISTCKNTVTGIGNKIVDTANKPYEKAKAEAEQKLAKMNQKGDLMGKGSDGKFVDTSNSLQQQFDRVSHSADQRASNGKIANVFAASRMKAVARKADVTHKNLVKERNAQLKQTAGAGIAASKINSKKKEMGLYKRPSIQDIEIDPELELDLEAIKDVPENPRFASSSSTANVEPRVANDSFGGEMMAAQAKTTVEKKKIKVKITAACKEGKLDDNLGAACVAAVEGTARTNPTEFVQKVNKIPSPTIDTSDLESQLSKLTSVPNAKDFGGKKFEDLGAYKKDVGDRYTNSSNSYKQAIENAKSCVSDYNKSGKAEALKMAEKFIAEAANHRLDMENIKIEIDDKGDK